MTRSASRTAVLVCQARAVAHGRLAPGRFDDPVALPLLRPDERAPVEAPSLRGRVGRVLARAMARVGGGSDPTAREPQRSSWTPAAMADRLAHHGLRVERDGDLGPSPPASTCPPAGAASAARAGSRSQGCAGPPT